MYWEYLPRKVIHKKGAKVVPSLKTGFEHKRSTVTLACTAWGDLLRPSIIVKRKRPYTLNCPNNIQMLLQKSDNAWTDAQTFVEWMEEILIPYVNKNQCLLLLDSYEAHICSDIRKFIVKYPYIHICVIPGSYTDILQPLDMGINAIFKAHCKSIALEFANAKMEALVNSQGFSEFNKQEVQLVFLAGNFINSCYDLSRRK